MKAYIDSSVVLRIIFGEKNALEFPDEIQEFVTSDILKIECFRTLDRMQRALNIPEDDIAERYAALYAIIPSFRFVKLNEAVCQRACDPFPVIIKSLDAIHLASAILWSQQEQKDIIFLTHDIQLSRAALALGFNVLGV